MQTVLRDQPCRDRRSNGGTDNGQPGPRPNYGPTYYAAFVHDPEGNNIEVMLA